MSLLAATGRCVYLTEVSQFYLDQLEAFSSVCPVNPFLPGNNLWQWFRRGTSLDHIPPPPPPLKIYHSFSSNMTCLYVIITIVGIYLPPLPFSPSFKHLWANSLAEKQRKWSLLIAVIPHSYIQLYNWQSTFAASSQSIIYIVSTNLTHKSVRISKIMKAKCLAQVHMACACWSQNCSLTLLILNAMLWQETAGLRADKPPFWDLNNTNNNH